VSFNRRWLPSGDRHRDRTNTGTLTVATVTDSNTGTTTGTDTTPVNTVPLGAMSRRTLRPRSARRSIRSDSGSLLATACLEHLREVHVIQCRVDQGLGVQAATWTPRLRIPGAEQRELHRGHGRQLRLPCPDTSCVLNRHLGADDHRINGQRQRRRKCGNCTMTLAGTGTYAVHDTTQ